MKFFKALYDLFSKPKKESKRTDEGVISIQAFAPEPQPPVYVVKVSEIEPINNFRHLLDLPKGVKFRLEVSQEPTFNVCYDIRMEITGIWITISDYANKHEGEQIALKRYICAAIEKCLAEHGRKVDNYQQFKILIPSYESLSLKYKKDSDLKYELRKDATLLSIITQYSELYLLGGTVSTNALCAKRESEYGCLTIKHVDLKIWRKNRIQRSTTKKE